MAEKPGRKPTSLKRILGSMTQNNYLNTDVVLGLRDWDKGLKEGKFRANAKTKEQAVARTETLMRGLGDSKRLAEGWIYKDGSVSPDSEAGLRARLSDEMAFCLRRGGVLLPSGEVRQDLSGVVEEVAYELKPELKEEAQRELKRGLEGEKPTIIEGTYKEIS